MFWAESWQRFQRAFTASRQALADRALEATLGRAGLHPDTVTLVGLLFSGVAAVMILKSAFGWAAAFLGGSVIADAADGYFARRAGLDNPAADLAADRYSELVVALALVVAVGSWAAWSMYVLSLINIFLPRRFMPVLPHRFFLLAYLLALAFWAPGLQ